MDQREWLLFEEHSKQVYHDKTPYLIDSYVYQGIERSLSPGSTDWANQPEHSIC